MLMVEIPSTTQKDYLLRCDEAIFFAHVYSDQVNMLECVMETTEFVYTM